MDNIKKGDAVFADFMEYVVEMCLNEELRKAVFIFDYGDKPKMVAFNGIGWDGGLTESESVQLEDIKMILQEMLTSQYFREQ